MRKLARVTSAVSLLLTSLIAAGSPSHADSVTLLIPPVISLQKAGTTFTLTPATWTAPTQTVITWLINGKAVANSSRKSFTAPSKKGTVVQVRESAGALSALSNRITVGAVAVNGLVSIAFNDSTHTSLGSSLPKSFPLKSSVTYQWFSGPFEIRGAHSPTYTPATGDQGSDISLRVTYAAKGLISTASISNVISLPVVARNYALAWSDEFNAGTAINSKVWGPENGDGTAFHVKGWGNNERQYYLDSQSSIDPSGALTISAARKGAGAYNCYYGTACEWVSSRFSTKGLIGFKYGRVEARVKGPIGEGTWAAFWMLGANIDERPWPGCGEIDITELLGRDPLTVYGTPHGPASGDSYTTTINDGFSNDFHTYAVDWLPDQITWYFDGKPYGTYNKASLDDPTHTWVFDHEFYLIANLAMGGGFGGAINSTLTDANTSIDYVRFYTINGVGEVINH